MIDRRKILALLAAMPVAGLACSGGLVASWWHQAAGAGRIVLSDEEYAFVQAAAEAWMPAGGDPALSGADADLGAFVDLVVSRMPDPERSLVRLLFNALDDLTVPSHLGAFHTLSLEERTSALQAWVDSPSANIRQATRALLALLSEGWTQHPDVVAYLTPEFSCGVGP